MLFSMTGFGKGESQCRGTTLTVQISSVNRKQFELRCSLPQELAFAEVHARKIVAATVSRGAVQLRCSLTASPDAVGESRLNTVLLDRLIRESRAARVRGNLSEDVAVESLMSLPGVWVPVSSGGSEDELFSAFETALKQALSDYNTMRQTEGDALAQDLLMRIEKLENIHARLAEMSAAYPEAAKKRLLARIEAEKLPVAPDDPALLREVLFYVDKGDVTEELTRLSSHFLQVRKFLTATSAAGRNLDFLAQEIFREITTFGNKSAVPETSPLVVDFKAEMEKIREQIQNIE